MDERYAAVEKDLFVSRNRAKVRDDGDEVSLVGRLSGDHWATGIFGMEEA